METFFGLVGIGAIGYVVFKFFRSNTERGANTVRAYIYIGLLTEGETPEAANAMVAKAGAMELPADMIREAMAYVQSRYDGKQLPFIADAVRAGFTPR